MMPEANARELAQLRDEGYFVRRGFFTPAEMDELEPAADQAIRWRNDRLYDYDDLYARVSAKDGITFVNQLTDDSPARAELERLCLGAKMASFARSLAGPRAAHFMYQLIYKHPGFDRPFPWHQDINHTPSFPRLTTLWIALSDMNVANGCIWVNPGTALDEVLTYHETPYGLACWPMSGASQGIPLEIERGSIFVFAATTLHKSGGNASAQMRKAMLVAFVDERATVDGKPLELTPYPTEG